MLGLKNIPAVLAGVLLLAGHTVSAAAIQREPFNSGIAALNLRDNTPPPTCGALHAIDGENQDPDADTPDPNLFTESIEGETTCAAGAGGGGRRSLEAVFVRSDNLSHLEKRGSSRTYQVCGTGSPPSTITLPAYPGAVAVSRAQGKGWIYASNQDNCGDAGIVVKTGRPMNIPFALEHVFEGQSMKLYLQYMISGTLPSGGAVPGGAATVQGIFDPNGVFFKAWPSVVPQPAFGLTPAETLMGLLGHNAGRGGAGAQADITNLQVLQRDLNAYKALLNAGKNFVSDTTFASYSAKEKMHLLGSIQDMFQYLQLDQTVQSYNTVYKGLINVWDNFAAIPAAQAGYNYANAFDAVLKDDLANQIVLAKQRYMAIITNVSNYFQSAASAQEDPTFKATAQTTLQQLTANIDTAIAYRIDAMTARP